MSDYKLRRVVGFNELLIYSIGVIFGAGIYALIGKAAGATGPSVWLSFLFAAIIASFTGLSYAELASIKSTTSAEYTYTKLGFGSRRAAFVVSWLINAVNITSITTVALGFAGYFVSLFAPGIADSALISFSEVIVTPVVLVAICLIGTFAFVNYMGIKKLVKFNMVFTAAEALGLMMIITIGGLHFAGGGAAPNLLEMPFGISGMFSAVALIFFAYLGFEGLANLGMEVVDAKKTIPRVMVLSIVITTVVYVLVALSSVSVISWQELGASSQPLADVADTVLGNKGGLVLSFIALFATANTVLILITGSSRVLYGMAKDGSLPSPLRDVSKRRRTPFKAIIIVSMIAAAACFLKSIELVAELTTLGVFIVFAVINLSLIRIRFVDKLPKDRFKSPLNVGRFPVLAGLGIVSCAWMISTYVVKFTPSGVFFEALNPAVVLVIMEIATGFIAYKLLNRNG
ncbi:MAG: APC family permease [archaeon]